MKTTHFTLCLLLLVAAPLLAVTNLPERERLLIGTWSEELTDRSFRGVGEKTFYSDGSATGWFKLWRRDKSGREVLDSEFTYKSRWRIEGDVMISYDVHTMPAGVLDPKEEIRDIIISIDAKEFRYKADDGAICVFKKKT